MLSVIVPAYNEDKLIQIAYNTLNTLLESHGIENEIIFVDDGSTDMTQNLI
ncbi:MAG: glycosyltransferase [Ruminococcaceae bacterium]|nr:glycosyltransferase [Oscillospiraceae bacterium]